MRGRLIFPFVAELFQLDTRAPASRDPKAADPIFSDYDPDFKEPRLLDANDDGVAEPGRRERPPLRVPCQVEPELWGELHRTPAGNSPRSKLALIFHFRDLERLGMVDAATGEASIRPSDRLGGLYDSAGRLIQTIPTPPGLYVTEARPLGFGFGGRRPARNLLLVNFEDRRVAREY